VLFADANGGWSTHRPAGSCARPALDYYLEQPCATYDECRALRSDCDRPWCWTIDTDLAALLKAHATARDAVTIKIARLAASPKRS